MTAPVPASPSVPDPRDRLTGRLLSYGLSPGQVREALLDADAYAADMIEQWARPDDRWEPK